MAALCRARAGLPIVGEAAGGGPRALLCMGPGPEVNRERLEVAPGPAMLQMEQEQRAGAKSPPNSPPTFGGLVLLGRFTTKAGAGEILSGLPHSILQASSLVSGDQQPTEATCVPRNFQGLNNHDHTLVHLGGGRRHRPWADPAPCTSASAEGDEPYLGLAPSQGQERGEGSAGGRGVRGNGCRTKPW